MNVYLHFEIQENRSGGVLFWDGTDLGVAI